MNGTHRTSRPVVVGIDGSRSAVAAARWAADEAVARDAPLRLLYAIEPCSGDDPQQADRRLATAQLAIRHAVAAVESTEKSVKIETEIVVGRPTEKLRQASRSAAMVCVGALGLKRATVGNVGSTAAALATSTHCAVAIIRSYDPSPVKPGLIIAEIDESPSSTEILEVGIAQARRRGAPLQFLTTWQSEVTDTHDAHAVLEGNQRVLAQLDRRVAWWNRKHPDLAMQSVADHGTTPNYLARNAADIQLVVVGRDRVQGLNDIVGPRVQAPLHDSNCSVLICNRRSEL